MCNSISKTSILRANRSLMDNRGKSFSSSGGNASISCNTIFGRKTLSVPTQKIIDAANNVRAHHF